MTYLVVLCAGKVDAPLNAVRQVLGRLDLTLNEAKTRIVDARQESFNFLGFAIRVSKGWKSGKSYPHACPAPKSLVKIKDRITQLTARKRTLIPLDDIVGSVNATLRGWANYFHYRNSSSALEKVKVHAEERLRTHLMKRHKDQRSVGSALAASRASSFIRNMDYTRFRQRQAGSRRMPSEKNIGKPCAGKLHARFDEEGLVKLPMEWLLRHRQTKGAEQISNS